MTPQDHNKALGIMHLIYGGFHTLVFLMVVVLYLFMAGILGAALSNAPPGDAPPEFVFGILLVVMLILLLIYALLAVPGLLAGYALLKRKSWAKTAGIVASVVSALSFPFGTALAVYSFWFFFGEGKRFYDSDEYYASARRGQLHDAYDFQGTYGWETRSDRASDREAAYVPPRQPPDWRDS
ncbi:MAG TPA: hypothetical protein VGB73_10550 [Pyrinomonadaceae bacterium]|jgi:hypothetical protein